MQNGRAAFMLSAMMIAQYLWYLRREPVPITGSHRGEQLGIRGVVTAVLLGGMCAGAGLSDGARPSVLAASNRCPVTQPAVTGGVELGRQYVQVAYQALMDDRYRFASLGPLRQSAVLSAMAEHHSAYMASIGTWSDGDPAGGILERVRASGLSATYAGQNVVTSFSPDVPSAVTKGESFFAREAEGGGPHWDNITNPNHHFVGIGIAVTGSSGAYMIYLTQVFSDVGDCEASASSPTFSIASSTAASLRTGQIVHPTTDALQLRSGPRGVSIAVLTPRDRLRVLETQQGWVHVKVLTSGLFGWVFAGFVGAP